ncbi:MAG: hypothetical protein WDW38_007986 [Sanguina aurantia]
MPVEHFQRQRGYGVRCGLLAVLGVCAMAVAAAVLLLAPLLLGRAVLSVVAEGGALGDLFALSVGGGLLCLAGAWVWVCVRVCGLWLSRGRGERFVCLGYRIVGSGGRVAVDGQRCRLPLLLPSHNTRVQEAAARAMALTASWAKAGTLLALWMGVVPLLVGVLAEQVLLPLRLPANERPLLALSQDWTIGLLLVKMWQALIMRATTPRLDAVSADDATAGSERLVRDPGSTPGQRARSSFLASAARPGTREARWRGAVEALQRVRGIQDLEFRTTMELVVLPMVLHLATALALPYAAPRLLLPALGLRHSGLSADANRYSHCAVISAWLLVWLQAFLLRHFRRLHTSLRDERYLVGRQLHNFDASALLVS